MDTEQITALTLQAWDELQAEEDAQTTDAGDGQQTAEVVEEPAAESDSTDTELDSEESDAADEDQAEHETEEDEPERADEEQEDAEEQAEEEVSAGYETADPRVKAFLDKYGGDPEKALAAAVHLEQVLGRQGRDLGLREQRIQELEQQMQDLATFGPGGVILTPEQKQWAEQAVESDNPGAYVQEAMRAGEFGLARAVCDGWAQESPYEAARAAQTVDAVEYQTQQRYQAETTEQVQFDQSVLMEVLVENFPDMPQYEQQMLSTLSALGEHHPLVQDARSTEPETAAKGIIGLYEIARAQTATAKTTRAKVKRDGRQAADDARTRAVVSSAQASPKTTEAPREREIMPGLTLSQLDEAWGS